MRIRLLARDYVRPGSDVGSEHDVSESVANRLIERGVAQQAARGDTPDESWTVRNLRVYAGEVGIDLGDATKKSDILATIHGADSD
jgi:hypothetical protein